MNKQQLTEIFKPYEPKMQLSGDEFENLKALLLSKEKNFSIDIDEIDRNSDFYKSYDTTINSTLTRLFLKKLNGNKKIRMTLGTLLVLMPRISDFRTAEIFAMYFQYKLSRNTLVDLNIFCESLFPWGYYSDEQLADIWDLKMRTIN